MTEPAAPDPATAVPRLATFSLEGRAVPALYLVGWIASVMGLAIILVSLLATSGVAAAWLFLAGDVVLAIGLVAAGGSQAIERGRRTELAYRGPSPVLAFLAVFAVTIIATVAVLAPLSAIGLDAGSPAATTIQLTITMFAYIGIIRLLVVGPGSLSWAEMHVTRPSAAAVRDLLIGALLALPVLVVALTLAAVVGRFVTPAPSPLPPATNVTGLVLNLISAAIIAPIGEELFFRGFATTAWAKTEGPARGDRPRRGLLRRRPRRRPVRLHVRGRRPAGALLVHRPAARRDRPRLGLPRAPIHLCVDRPARDLQRDPGHRAGRRNGAQLGASTARWTPRAGARRGEVAVERPVRGAA